MARSAALREMHRVLAPGGCAMVAVFDQLSQNPWYQAMAEVLEEVVGSEVAGASRAPFALGDAAALKALCDEPGVPANISSREGTARYIEFRDMVLADVQGWFPLTGTEPSDSQINRIVEQLASRLEAFQLEDENLSFPMPAHLIVIRKPAG